MRWIIGTSLKLRYLVVVGASMLMFFGVLQIRNMPVDAYPEFAPPQVEVQTLCSGMSARDVEELVTVPMEQGLAGVEGLQDMRSKSVSQLSSIVLIFKSGTNLMNARLLVQERLTAISARLPRWANSPFMIQPLSATSRVMKIGMSQTDQSDAAAIQMALFAYWTLRPRLMRVPGVANVAIWGDRWATKQIQVDPVLMKQHNVTLAQVLDAAGDAVDVGQLKFRGGFEIGTGGWVDTPNQRFQVQHQLPNLTPEQLAMIPIPVPEGARPVYLKDVARISDGLMPSSLLGGDAVVNDGPGLILIVEKLPWGNTLQVTRDVEAAIKDFGPGMRGYMVTTQIFRPATFIQAAVDNLARSMVVGFLLIVLILVLFLFEWRVALMSTITIPLSLVTAGLVLYYAKATINTMILAGLVISLGVLVDDAIIDIENIVRRIRQHRLEGSTKSTASIIFDASIEVRGPIVHATMIILVSTVTGVPARRPDRRVLPAAGAGVRPGDPRLAAGRADRHPGARAPAPVRERADRAARLAAGAGDCSAVYTLFLARIVPRPAAAYATVGAGHGRWHRGHAAAGPEPVPGVQGTRLPDPLDRPARYVPGGDAAHHRAGQPGTAGDTGGAELRLAHRAGHPRR